MFLPLLIHIHIFVWFVTLKSIKSQILQLRNWIKLHFWDYIYHYWFYYSFGFANKTQCNKLMWSMRIFHWFTTCIYSTIRCNMIFTSFIKTHGKKVISGKDQSKRDQTRAWQTHFSPTIWKPESFLSSGIKSHTMEL